MESAIWYSCWNATLSRSGMENQNSFFDGLPSVKSVIKMGCLLSLFQTTGSLL